MTAFFLVILTEREKNYFWQLWFSHNALKFLVLLTVHERLCTKRQCECHLFSLSSSFLLLSHIAKHLISAIDTKGAANTASNHLNTLTFKGCKQRVNILL